LSFKTFERLEEYTTTTLVRFKVFGELEDMLTVAKNMQSHLKPP